MDIALYFANASYSFYRLKEEGTILETKDGATLLYTRHLQELLTDLALPVLPRLDSFLLLHNCTQLVANDLVSDLKVFIQTMDRFDQQASFNLECTGRLLQNIQALPIQHREGEGRLFMLQTLLSELADCWTENQTRHLRASLREQGKALPAHLHAYEVQQYIIATPHNSVPSINSPCCEPLLVALKALRQLCQRYPTVAQLQRAIEEQYLLLQPPQLEENETAQPSEQWKENLKDHPAAFPILALAPHFQAILRLPQLHISARECSSGGTTDLANRGNLDQLLLSEHAYDSLFLLSRLVNREALYRQRETAHCFPHPSRVLLLDVSLKNWGTPKVLHYAITWALKELPETPSIKAIYAIGHQVWPLNWSDENHFIRSLSHISPALDASEGLRQFFNDYSLHPDVEILWLSAERAQSDALNAVLRGQTSSITYGLYTTPEGQVRVQQYRPHYRELQTLVLPLDDLWTCGGIPTPSLSALPRGHSDTRLPILLPMRRPYRNAQYLPKQSIFMLTPNHNLLYYAGSVNDYAYSQKGWHWLMHTVPDGLLWQVGQLHNGSHVLLVVQTNNYRLLWIDIQSGHQLQLPRPNIRRLQLEDIVFHENTFYLLGAGHSCWQITATPNLTMEEQPSAYSFAHKLARRADQFWNARQPKGLPKVPYNLLQRIKSVYVHADGMLILNERHGLAFEGGRLAFVPTKNARRAGAQTAGRYSNQHYRFSSGHQVIFHALGFMILKSPERSQPNLYVPLTLKRDLGIACFDAFAGSSYFQPPGIKVISLADFHERYYQPWIDAVLSYSI